MTVEIRCHNVVKRFDTRRVLDQVDWTVSDGTVVGLLGGSGAGKTTLLRIIAGLETCTTGRVVVQETKAGDGTGRPAIGMVFQNLALWPHLTARRHVEGVMRSTPRRQRRDQAEGFLREVRLPEATWGHRPSQLSGGEAQRLALARALAVGPDLLLLDEPLAQVDSALREELLELMTDVLARRDLTAVYVTHSWAEATRVAEQIAVMKDGRIVLEGAPDEVFWAVDDSDVARLTGPVVELPVEWVREGLVAVEAGPLSRQLEAPGPQPSLLVRPQQLRLVDPHGHNRWNVVECRPDGRGWQLLLEQNARRLTLSTAVLPQHWVGVELCRPGEMDCRH